MSRLVPLRHVVELRALLDGVVERPINFWISTGAGLLVMGVLTLAMPLFTALESRQTLIDGVAGGGLVIAGIASLVQGFRVWGRSRGRC